MGIFSGAGNNPCRCIGAVLTLLIHLGYLAYDSEKKEAFVPNREIIEEFENAMSVGGWSNVMRVLRASERLLQDTLQCDEESVAAGLDRAHTEAASILAYNDENSLSCSIGLAYYSARKDYRLIRKLPLPPYNRSKTGIIQRRWRGIAAKYCSLG